jgi:hypothetical protein
MLLWGAALIAMFCYRYGHTVDSKSPHTQLCCLKQYTSCVDLRVVAADTHIFTAKRDKIQMVFGVIAFFLTWFIALSVSVAQQD